MAKKNENGVNGFTTGLLHFHNFQRMLVIAEPEWLSGLQCCACCVQHGRLWVRALNLHQYLWTSLQVHELKRLGSHADLYTVSRCCTRGDSEDHTSEKACKGSILALKPMADITRSPKQGHQWSHKKDQKFKC